MEEGKNKSAWWAELHADFLAVMEELSSGKAPVFGFLLTHGQQPMAWPYSQTEGNGNLAY